MLAIHTIGENMKNLNRLLSALAIFCAAVNCPPAMSAEMTFQMVNDTERSLNLKLFSRGESLQQWPSKTKAYSIMPGAEIQQIKITCEAGEQICWGAWMVTQSVSGEIVGPAGERRQTRTAHIRYGVGERAQRPCERCCHICTEGVLVPAAKVRDPLPAAK